MHLYLLSFDVELLDRSVIHLFITSENALISIHFQLLLFCCAFDCILLLCITQQQQAELQQPE